MNTALLAPNVILQLKEKPSHIWPYGYFWWEKEKEPRMQGRNGVANCQLFLRYYGIECLLYLKVFGQTTNGFRAGSYDLLAFKDHQMQDAVLCAHVNSNANGVVTSMTCSLGDSSEFVNAKLVRILHLLVWFSIFRNQRELVPICETIVRCLSAEANEPVQSLIRLFKNICDSQF